MPLTVPGQRCLSEREPELGLGLVVSVDRSRIAVRFPATGEERLYAADTPVLRRVQFRVGDTVAAREGPPLPVEAVEDEGGLLVYLGAGRRVREDQLSDVTSVDAPPERLLAGQVDAGEVFELRLRALQAQAKFRQSAVRGFPGGRVELIPHQFYILHEVAARQIPRVLLADEVGLGKTIEACLIVQRLLAVGRARRVLVLVPESLVHQWFVELLRRFNLWFSIYDEERSRSLEAGEPGANPFLDEQLVLCSVAFLAGDEARQNQAVAAGWDMVVVDEAHHLGWAPDHVSREYALVEALGRRSPGLLLLTATPTQLGLPGHFARLRLLDPDRYGDYEAFLRETEAFADVAAVAEKLLEEKPLKPRDRAALARLFEKDRDGLERRLAALAAGEAGAREALLRTLLDRHGTGRVMFRNTRAAMTGFPKRKFEPAPLEDPNPTLRARLARELEAEETGNESSIRHSFRDDPRIAWLASFLGAHRRAKVLLICRSPRKVLAIEAALREAVAAKVALFHEGLPLVQRDRNAAWFAEPDGARLLLCSEIGSEGRNFQFAHHLVLFDLPLNPGLVEQRIGRLDRIGQTQTIHIHAPYVAGSGDELVVDWYHRGLGVFEHPVHGGDEFMTRFRERLLVLALTCGRDGTGAHREEIGAFLDETAAFRRELALRLKHGRDRLLELHSFDRETAGRVVELVRAADADPAPRRILFELLDHFGVRIAEHEGGEFFLDPAHAYVEAFPAIPPEGMLATFDRRRALSREDVRFLSQDHPLLRDTLDLLLDSQAGTTAFAFRRADAPDLALEAVFVLEAVAESRWQVEQFLAPTPLRVAVSLRADAPRGAREDDDELEEADIHRFLEQPGFNAGVLKSLVQRATEEAETGSRALRTAAAARAREALEGERQRLVDLRKVNDHVRPEEIALAGERLRRTTEAIAQARLRLDSLRLVLEGPRAF